MASTNRQFRKDLVRGKEGEDIVCEFLKTELGIVTESLGGENPHWDLDGRHRYTTLLDNDKDVSAYRKWGVTYEVKTDDTSQRTGNFYYEVWSNKGCKNAGCIPNCKADTIVILSGCVIYLIDRALFYSWVFENLYLNTELAEIWREKTNKVSRGKGLACARKNSDVQGILIPLEHIEESICIKGVFELCDE